MPNLQKCVDQKSLVDPLAARRHRLNLVRRLVGGLRKHQLHSSRMAWFLSPPPAPPPTDTVLWVLLRAVLRVSTFAAYVPCAFVCYRVWRAKAPAALASVLAAGALAHGAVWHLVPLVPSMDTALDPAKRALGGFHLAFLATFLIACFADLPFERCAWLSCAVLGSLVVDAFGARDLPAVLLCGLDATCWELPADPERELAGDFLGIGVKLASSCVLAVASCVGAHDLGYLEGCLPKVLEDGLAALAGTWEDGGGEKAESDKAKRTD